MYEEHPPDYCGGRRQRTMAKHHNIAEWHGKDLVDSEGRKIG